MEININVKFEDRFIKALEGLGKVYAVIQPDRIDKERYEAIKAAEAVQGKEKEIVKGEEEKKSASAPTEEAVPATVPTSKPAYNFEQIQLAAANLARDGKRDELAGLIEEFKIATLLDLTEDKFDAFVLRLREIGGAI